MLCNGQTLLIAAAKYPKAIAVIDGSLQYTYGELLDKARRLVTGFDLAGFTPGVRVVVIMQNTADLVIVYWAAQLAGVVITPINWRVSPSEADYYLSDSEAVAVIGDHSAGQVLCESKVAIKITRITSGINIENTVSLHSMIAHPPATDVPRVSASEVSVMLYTSGTTGAGKGVPRSHSAERAAALAHVAQNAYIQSEVTLGVMPMYHTMGIRILLAMTLTNGVFVCQSRFDADIALRLIAQHRVSVLYLVPTLYHDLVALVDQHDTSSVRNLGFAGASMTDDLLDKLNVRFTPDLFVNHYGSTEIYTFTVEQQAVKKPGSAGRAGLNSEIRVIPLDSHNTEKTVSAEQEGQVIARFNSDEAFDGYWRRPDADAKAFIDGWYLTGDVGYFDHDGDLFVTGRVDDMIITGGENVLPAEIESVLSLHPAVGEVAVAGCVDARWGQAVTAFISCVQSVDETALDQWCRQSTLADFKRPRRYIFVREIPKSPVGKILRRALISGQYELQTQSVA